MNTVRGRAATLALLLLALSGCADQGPDEGAGTASPSEGTSTDADVAAAPTEQSESAADWLAGQLDGGLLSYRTEFGPFTDHGMSIDAALALDAVGGHEAEVAGIADAVAADLTSYTEFPSGQGTHVSAGPVAKALLVAQVAGEAPADQVAQLERLTDDSGRIADRFPQGNRDDADYANVIGQVYAVRALSTAGSPEAAAAQDQLLAQQCEGGGFRADLGEQPCAAADADPDTTALAVVGLTAVEDPSEELAGATEAAADWLAGEQAEDGSVAGGEPAAPNANSTGLAGWAFGSTGRADAAASASGWLAGVQVADGPDAGALGLDPAAAEAAAADGLPAAARSQFLLATAQALPSLLRYRS